MPQAAVAAPSDRPLSARGAQVRGNSPQRPPRASRTAFLSAAAKPPGVMAGSRPRASRRTGAIPSAKGLFGPRRDRPIAAQEAPRDRRNSLDILNPPSRMRVPARAPRRSPAAASRWPADRHKHRRQDTTARRSSRPTGCWLPVVERTRLAAALRPGETHPSRPECRHTAAARADRRPARRARPRRRAGPREKYGGPHAAPAQADRFGQPARNTSRPCNSMRYSLGRGRNCFAGGSIFF